eukprot:CAMPEP_0197468762 /NCGR_PEP_ID=MMETSP1175-20131217/66253_1 /TAXON_ID=1003142 /ORGANISM="Triceratium dubium, Strain CCMP147" /LENGTH=579 /DNA_ID=CAMNT_0043004881 /DNA_START=145 /DNA_END=1884 /DNA_ORIENTATION=-
MPLRATHLMHAFTPQQLSGGQRYGNRTKIGNWQEELCLHEEKEEERNKKQSRHGRFEEKIRRCTSPIEQVRSSDGIVHYGRPLSLLHLQTRGTLACDPYEAARGDDCSEFVASVCPPPPRGVSSDGGGDSNSSGSDALPPPMARNSFLLRPVRSHEGGGRRPESGGSDCSRERPADDDVVRWGEPFRIECCPSLVASADEANGSGGRGKEVGNAASPDNDGGFVQQQSPPLYLASRRTALSCRQLLYLTRDGSSYDTHWAAHVPAKSKDAGFARFGNAGAPVLSGESLVLQHCATKELLSADAERTVATDFGTEFEVCVESRHTCGRVGLLRDEFRGTKTSATNCRPELVQNVWRVAFLSSRGEGGGDGMHDSEGEYYEGILSKTWDMLRKRGLFSFRLLSQYLSSAAAEENNGTNDNALLGKKMAHWIFSECGLRLDEEQFNTLINSCGGGSDDSIMSDGDDAVVDVVSLRDALRGGRMDDARKRIVADTYAKLGSSVDEDTLMAAWDSLSRSGILLNVREMDFLDLWDWSDEGLVLEDAFFDFHADLSAEIQDDISFARIMDILWNEASSCPSTAET